MQRNLWKKFRAFLAGICLLGTASAWALDPGTATFKYLQAENGVLSGGATVVQGWTWGDTSFEASGKATVLLADANGRITLTSPASDRLIVRYSLLNDAPDTVVEVRQNGVWIKDITLSSLRIRKGADGPPSGEIRYYDDIRINLTILAGDKIGLKKKTSDGVLVYIDFVEVEKMPAKLPAPAGYIAPASYDTTGIRTAIQQAASTSHKTVFLKSDAEYLVNDAIVVSAGVKMTGEGPFYTKVIFSSLDEAEAAFNLLGGNTISNLEIQATTTSRTTKTIAIKAVSVSGNVVDNVWSDYATLFFGQGTNDNIIKNSRGRNAYQDTIHFAWRNQGNLVENNHVRNSGDDGIAFISYSGSDGMIGNTAKGNFVELGYWGRGITIIGGIDQTLESNYVRDWSAAGILIATEDFENNGTPQPNDYNQNFMVKNNVIVRCGNGVNTAWGSALAIWGELQVPFYGTVTNNTVAQPPFHTTSFSGYVGSLSAGEVVNFTNNTLAAPLTMGYVAYNFNGLNSNSNIVFTGNNPNP